MNSPTRPAALLAATALALFALTACGGGSSTKSSADAQLSAIQSAEAQASSVSSDLSDSSAASDSSDSSAFSDSSDSSSASSGASAAGIDVCALLSPSDASAVASADKLDSAQTASTAYKLTATNAPDAAGPGDSACRFTIDDGGAEGTVAFVVQTGSNIALYNDGTKVDGLGDEAYTNSNGGTVVRVGGLMITEADDSCGSDITTDLLRKMAPHLH